MGRSKIIQSNNDTEYVNEIVRLYIEHSGIDHRLVTSYHPHANSIVERWVSKKQSPSSINVYTVKRKTQGGSYVLVDGIGSTLTKRRTSFPY